MKLPEPATSWGILGGQFDPIHSGHLNLARELMIAKALDGVLFVPSIAHAFKNPTNVSSFDDRAEMVSIALTDKSNMTCSLIEKEEQLSGYTVDTLSFLIKSYPETNFYFIMGADNIEQLKQWHNWKQIVKLVIILAGNRPGAELVCPSFIDPTRLEVVNTTNIEISSTAIRDNIRTGSSSDQIKAMLPPGVYEYIIEKGLYCNG